MLLERYLHNKEELDPLEGTTQLLGSHGIPKENFLVIILESQLVPIEPATNQEHFPSQELKPGPKGGIKVIIFIQDLNPDQHTSMMLISNSWMLKMTLVT